MGTVSLSTVWDTLKNTIDTIVDDSNTKWEAKADFTKWMEQRSMSDAYEDDLEMAGPGLASEVSETVEIPVGDLREGSIYRYTARKFGLKMVVSEEAVADSKYQNVFRFTDRLSRSLWKTADIDAANILVRATDSNYVGGDGVVLGSASHTLAEGGTYSNLMSTAMSPSAAAVGIATSAIRKQVGHDGQVEGYEPTAVMFPTEQWKLWAELTESSMAPEGGNYAKINVVKGLNLKTIPIRQWSNTTTNYCFLTDAPDQPNWRWRQKPEKRSWLVNDNQVMYYSVHARWANGYSDPRAFYFVNA